MTLDTVINFEKKNVYLRYMKKIVFKEEEISDIIELYTNGESLRFIGSKYNVNKHTIRKLLDEHNIVIHKPGSRYKGGKSESDKRYYDKNKDKISLYYKDWYKDNKDYLKEYHYSWRKDNESYKEYKRDYEKNKVDSDPLYRLNKNFRTLIYNYLLKYGDNTDGSSKDIILNYTVEDLIKHLESQFTEGMTWDNYGEWHIDHTIPVSYFKPKDKNDFLFYKCWSLNNLRPMWSTTREINGVVYEGNLNKGDEYDNECYQYIVREQRRVIEENNIPFDINKVDLHNTIIKQISREDSEKIIKQYEWLENLPKFSKYYFGIYFIVDGKEYLGGTLVFQDDYSKNTKVWDKYNFTGEMLLLSRGVCVWWTPKNTASYFISRVLDWFKHNTNYRVFTASVDKMANEIGTIYQANNWCYLGIMEGNIKNGKPLKRMSAIVDGELLSSRTLRARYGTMAREKLKEKVPDIIFIEGYRKERYITFIGGKKEIKYNKRKIKNNIKDYPKR